MPYINLSSDEFEQLKRDNYTHIPLIKKQLMDNDTPVSVFSKLRDLNGASYLFESVQGGERWGRFSMIGLGNDVIIEYQNQTLTIKNYDQTTTEKTESPIEYLREFMQQYRMPDQSIMPELPVFSGGLVGYFGYDMIRTIEPILGQGDAANPLGLPDMWLVLSTSVIVFDNLENTLNIIVWADCETEDSYATAVKKIDIIQKKLSQAANLTTEKLPSPKFVSNTGEAIYSEYVEKIKEYILAGDVMQVVPAQRMSATYTGDALNVYRALRYLNPSPYLFLIHGYTIGDHRSFDVIGASPEVLCRVEHGKVTVRPLAGTRPRGSTTEEDLQLEEDLLSDTKEIAEHLMLIDLGRNDVGRVSQAGQVTVTEQMKVERYSHVMHISSNVEGVLRDDIDALDAFAAVFPAGTLTGAPKIRAMQIIDELEPQRRTVFGGAVGYIGWHGNMDTAIAIRTAVARDEQIHVQSGGGIVADSVSSSEWQETQNKASAIVKAVEMAANGLLVK